LYVFGMAAVDIESVVYFELFELLVLVEFFEIDSLRVTLSSTHHTVPHTMSVPDGPVRHLCSTLL